MFHGSNVLRPQLKFEEKIDNTNTPFMHKLRVKPNALIPLHAAAEPAAPAAVADM